MNLRGNELGAIMDLLAERTRFVRPYVGEVLPGEDPERRGRVKCAVAEVGWLRADEAPWCEPVYVNGGQVTPPAGRFVMVAFLGGNPSRPVYLGEVGEVTGQQPAPYDGPSKRVLYADGTREVTYDAAADSLKVNGFGSVEINGNSKSFVTHAELDAALSAFVTQLGLTLASGSNGGGPVVFAVSPPSSIDISAAATATVKTGG